jgi:hypothetical protein
MHEALLYFYHKLLAQLTLSPNTSDHRSTSDDGRRLNEF